ncbi:MAG: Shikimate kinase [Planctomycetes bacterium]|nr:Shikimate kinase [Planctomycetota bacterium]
MRTPEPARAPDDLLLRAIGTQVRDRRKARSLTLAELAAASGVSSRFLTDVEAGRANISVVNLSHVAAALGARPEDLLHAPRERSVALLGLRGAGKSTVGRTLARKLGLAFVELDRLVEDHAGLPLRELFAVHGDLYYRRMESEALDGWLARPEPSVIATGGGIVTSPAAYTRLREECFTVWLRAKPEDHMARVERQGDYRPMARRPNAMAELRQILAARTPLYAQAHLTVDTSRLDAEAAAERIAGAMTSRRARP